MRENVSSPTGPAAVSPPFIQKCFNQVFKMTKVTPKISKLLMSESNISSKTVSVRCVISAEPWLLLQPTALRGRPRPSASRPGDRPLRGLSCWRSSLPWSAAPEAGGPQPGSSERWRSSGSCGAGEEGEVESRGRQSSCKVKGKLTLCGWCNTSWQQSAPGAPTRRPPASSSLPSCGAADVGRAGPRGQWRWHRRRRPPEAAAPAEAVPSLSGGRLPYVDIVEVVLLIFSLFVCLFSVSAALCSLTRAVANTLLQLQ